MCCICPMCRAPFRCRRLRQPKVPPHGSLPCLATGMQSHFSDRSNGFRIALRTLAGRLRLRELTRLLEERVAEAADRNIGRRFAYGLHRFTYGLIVGQIATRRHGVSHSFGSVRPNEHHSFRAVATCLTFVRLHLLEQWPPMRSASASGGASSLKRRLATGGALAREASGVRRLERGTRRRRNAGPAAEGCTLVATERADPHSSGPGLHAPRWTNRSARK